MKSLRKILTEAYPPPSSTDNLGRTSKSNLDPERTFPPKAFKASPTELDNTLETVLSAVISLELYDQIKQEIIRLKAEYPDPDMRNQDNRTLSLIQKFKDEYDKDVRNPDDEEK